MIKKISNKENRSKDGAARQQEWKNRQRKIGRVRRFDQHVTEEEYKALKEHLAHLRNT